ncbi:MAG: hypothetical protein QOG11_605, partial [Solirubrobacteraceae bacterium]|nr:hypothetical protein [Solirubrobacteraceae bacterium]
MEAATTQGPAQGTQQNIGRIEEIQGVVIEVVFPDALPEINTALTIEREGENPEEAPGISSGL